MSLIGIINDEDHGLVSKEVDSPRLRQGARGIVINDNGKIAIFNKSKKNEYKLPGGGIENDETPEEAFVREVLEETGCEVQITEKLGTIEENKTLDNFKQISHVFVGKVVSDSYKLNLTEKEQAEGGQLLWLSLEEALERISNCYNLLVASDYESVYHTKFIVLRDRRILEFYLNSRK